MAISDDNDWFDQLSVEVIESIVLHLPAKMLLNLESVLVDNMLSQIMTEFGKNWSEEIIISI